MHGLKEWGQQFLNTDDGMFMTGNKEKKIRISLVENSNNKQSPKGSDGKPTATGRALSHFTSPSGVEFVYTDGPRLASLAELAESRGGGDGPSIGTRAASGGSSGGGGSGGGGSSGAAGGKEGGKDKPTGQKTLHKEKTDIQIEQNGKETSSQHGQHYSSQRSGSDATVYTENRKKSSQSTDKHTHMRFQEHRIWNEEEGNFWTIPCLVKKDLHCKE